MLSHKQLERQTHFGVQTFSNNNPSSENIIIPLFYAFESDNVIKMGL